MTARRRCWICERFREPGYVAVTGHYVCAECWRKVERIHPGTAGDAIAKGLKQQREE